MDFPMTTSSDVEYGAEAMVHAPPLVSTAVVDEPAITYKAILDPKRCRANKKERERVDALRTEFVALRGVVPKVVAEPELTRIDVVRRAAEYIDYLSGILAASDAAPEDASLCSEHVLDTDELRTSFIAYKVEENTTQILPQKRVVCNARARNRSRRTKQAFEGLKQLVPIHPSEPELSRMDILRRASQYIAVMAKMLEDDDDAEIPSQATATAALELTSDMSTSGIASLEAANKLRSSSDISPMTCPTTALSNTYDSDAGSVSLASHRSLSLASRRSFGSPSPLNLDVPCTNLGIEQVDSDYGSMSPPASANSECSFTFPSISQSTFTTGSCCTTTTSCVQTTTSSLPDINTHFSCAQTELVPSASCVQSRPPPPSYHSAFPAFEVASDASGGGCLRSRRFRQTSRRMAQPYSPHTLTSSSPTAQCSSDSSYSLGSPQPMTPLTPITPLTRIYFNLVATSQMAWSPRLASRVCGSVFQPHAPPQSVLQAPNALSAGMLMSGCEAETSALERFFTDEASGLLSRQNLTSAWPLLTDHDSSSLLN